VFENILVEIPGSERPAKEARMRAHEESFKAQRRPREQGPLGILGEANNRCSFSYRCGKHFARKTNTENLDALTQSRLL